MIKTITLFLLLMLPLTSQAKDNYGVTHGLAVAGAVVATWVVADELFPNNKRVGDIAVTVVAIAAANYFYQRESKARAGNEWYLDSVADAAVPAAVSIFAISYRFK